jgi:pimeloyl-ACP methyl ester carboxylesterase
VPEAASGPLTICYETEGDPAGLPLLLVAGLGVQLTWWPAGFRYALADRGFFVIRYDNRDAGKSTWLDEAGPVDLMAVLGGAVPPPYLMSDLAADAMAILDALGLPSAHVLGVSMGGMIAQAIAIEHPGRVRSLTSIMSTTGDPSVGQPRADVTEMLLSPQPGLVLVEPERRRGVGCCGGAGHEDGKGYLLAGVRVRRGPDQAADVSRIRPGQPPRGVRPADRGHLDVR